MYKLYITFLFIISLSVFHQIESVDVELKNSVRGIAGNSFMKDDDIHLECDVKIGKEELTSLKIKFGNEFIYTYINKTIEVKNFSGVNVTEHKPEKNVHSIMINKANKDITGPYTCEIEYENEKKTKEHNSSELTMTFWDREVKNWEFKIHDEAKKEKDFKKGESLTLHCSANFNETKAISIELKHKDKRIFLYTFKDSKGVPSKTEDNTDAEQTPDSHLEVKIPKISDKMGGAYQCEIKFENGDKNPYTYRGSNDIGEVKAAATIFNISYALIVISFICTRFSFSK